MMLTLQTAKQLQVRDREDPAQSIEGGARYLRQLLRQLPASIAEPDRTWMALAAYNQGLGHLHDARHRRQRMATRADQQFGLSPGRHRGDGRQQYGDR